MPDVLVLYVQVPDHVDPTRVDPVELGQMLMGPEPRPYPPGLDGAYPTWVLVVACTVIAVNIGLGLLLGCWSLLDGRRRRRTERKFVAPGVAEHWEERTS